MSFQIGDNVLALHLALWQNARITGFSEKGIDVTLGSGERLSLPQHRVAAKQVPYKKERLTPRE